MKKVTITILVINMFVLLSLFLFIKIEDKRFKNMVMDFIEFTDRIDEDLKKTDTENVNKNFDELIIFCTEKNLVDQEMLEIMINDRNEILRSEKTFSKFVNANLIIFAFTEDRSPIQKKITRHRFFLKITFYSIFPHLIVFLIVFFRGKRARGEKKELV